MVHGVWLAERAGEVEAVPYPVLPVKAPLSFRSLPGDRRGALQEVAGGGRVAGHAARDAAWPPQAERCRRHLSIEGANVTALK